ncbi:MAG: glutamate 5-kinase [Prevotella sp.]
MRRIVIKVGSNVVTRADGKLDVTRISAIVDQIVWLRAQGFEVILVSSGAVAGGRSELCIDRRLDCVEQRQLFSAIGQVKLMGLYYDLFREHGLHIGQLLTMKESFATRREYLNQRTCMTVMLDNGVIPIVNENDTASITELMFTDNDELSGLVATMMGADALIILTNVDGIYNGHPDNPDSRLIRTVESDTDLSQYIGQERSGFGRGGMLTKHRIARKVADEGIRVVIANGKTPEIIPRLFTQPDTTPHTTFIPNATATSQVKKWIAHSESFTKGTVTVNEHAAQALTADKAASLLLVGVEQIEGQFEEGDLIAIADNHGQRIAIGRSAYAADEARALIGTHNVKPLVHYDYMYME